MKEQILYSTIIYGGSVAALRGILLNKSYNCDAEVEAPQSKVSIIMPAYNEEKYIKSALDSLLDQNIIKSNPSKFEIIVIDNASTDNTVNIVKQYPDIVGIVEEPRKGVLYAKDTGIKVATGNIIVATNADVYYPCNWLNILLKSFKDSGTVAVAGIVFYNGLGNLIPPMALLRRMPYMMGNNSAFLKTAYEQAPFDLSVDQTSSRETAAEEEKNFAVRLSGIGKVVRNWNAGVISSSRKWSLFDNKLLNEVKNKQRMGELITVNN